MAMLTSEPLFSGISHQKTNMGYLHKKLWKKNVLCKKGDEITRFDGSGLHYLIDFLLNAQFKGKGSLILLLNRGTVSMTSAAKITAGVVDTGGKFNADVIATGITKIIDDFGKKIYLAVSTIPAVTLTPVSRTQLVNLPAVSLTPAVHFEK